MPDQPSRLFGDMIRLWLQRRAGGNTATQGPITRSMVLDSGATSHFVRSAEALPATGTSRMSVQLPNDQGITVTHTVDLPFPGLSKRARHAHVLPHLTTNSLVSVPKLADAGYTVVFHPGAKGVTIHKPNSFSFRQRSKPVLQGWRDKNGLWQLGYKNASIMSKCQCSIKQQSSALVPTDTAANVYGLPSIVQVI